MPDRILPDRPNLEQYKKQAKELHQRLLPPASQPRWRACANTIRASAILLRTGRIAITLADAQLVLAREHGYESWPAFAKHIETLRIIRSVEDARRSSQHLH